MKIDIGRSRPKIKIYGICQKQVAELFHNPEFGKSF
jgi:hypothetical protein